MTAKIGSIVLVTGSAGLIGSESVRFFGDCGFTVVGIDNNMRQVFFGADASTEWNRDRLLQNYGDRYIHHNVDIREHEAISQIFQTYGKDISLIIHTAAQPSHDWAASDPYTDFTVNIAQKPFLSFAPPIKCMEIIPISCH
jgi:CDP-paratose 2-epimerase